MPESAHIWSMSAPCIKCDGRTLDRAGRMGRQRGCFDPAAQKGVPGRSQPWLFVRIVSVRFVSDPAGAIWILADFTGFWTTFHQLFFTNDLWLLNPATDRMINLFPEAFFSHLVIRILLWFLAFYLPCLIVAFYNRRQSIQMFFFPQSVGRRQKR